MSSSPPKAKCTIFAKAEGERPRIAGRFSFTKGTAKAVQVAWAVMDLDLDAAQYVVMQGQEVLAKSFDHRWEIYV